ncbi:hypothetical protein FSARC_2634 [Fusarium sarcochroum]|uniref:Uncharacterized protein n=1 Tax=Fusarium sarcochroum TaxID=1208366 RepID=A0A8H4U6A5_9HYPO|nr:hypothetical protein FSARC_2634 [Fusarium sarcochroum]
MVAILPELLTTQKSALHQSCVQALAAMYFGRTNRDIQACDQGTRLYSKALTQLRADISNSNTELSTIISVMCLCVYENVVFSQPTAWLMHYDGLGRLMQSRGPRPWKTREEREVLRFARYYTILSAGHQRRHCFLDQPQWESTRCTPDGDEPERIDLLYDIFAQSPGIVQDYDDLRQLTCASLSETETLRQRVQSVIDRLHAWLQGVPWICVPDPALRESNSMPLPDDPMDCVAMAVGYAMLLCLVQPCEYLQVALIGNHAADLVPNKDMASTTKFLALEICRFATWALRGEGSANYALSLVYPLQIAWFCLQNSEDDLCSVRGIMNSVVADSHGFELGRMRHWDESSLDQGRYGFLY